MTNMTQRIGDEVKSNYIEKMGKELGTQFYALWQEFIWLAMKWGEYEALYGGGSKRVDLLNDAAPAFFWMVDNVPMGRHAASYFAANRPACFR
jgi:hypothetical protein